MTLEEEAIQLIDELLEDAGWDITNMAQISPKKLYLMEIQMIG